MTHVPETGASFLVPVSVACVTDLTSNHLSLSRSLSLSSARTKTYRSHGSTLLFSSQTTTPIELI